MFQVNLCLNASNPVYFLSSRLHFASFLKWFDEELPSSRLISGFSSNLVVVDSDPWRVLLREPLTDFRLEAELIYKRVAQGARGRPYVKLTSSDERAMAVRGTRFTEYLKHKDSISREDLLRVRLMNLD